MGGFVLYPETDPRYFWGKEDCWWWSLVIGHWSLVIGHLLFVIGHLLFVICWGLFVICDGGVEGGGRSPGAGFAGERSKNSGKGSQNYRQILIFF
jgi:hypothetical protein